MNQVQSVEESIRQVYHRVERNLFGFESSDTRILTADNKVVIVARHHSPADDNAASLLKPSLHDEKLAYEEALRTEFANEFGCRIISMRTNIRLSDDEKMEIFQLNRPLN